VSRRVGPLDVRFEAGYFFARNGPEERILGLVVGRPVTARLELDAELYSDRAMGAPPTDTTFDLGLRCRVHPAFILPAMAGRSVNGSSDGHAQFLGYLGGHALLSDSGLPSTARPIAEGARIERLCEGDVVAVQVADHDGPDTRILGALVSVDVQPLKSADVTVEIVDRERERAAAGAFGQLVDLQAAAALEVPLGHLRHRQ
jgi:hypothetical protein